MPLRVGFDGRDLLRKRTGVVNYAVHLAGAMIDDPSLELLVYVDGFRDPSVNPPRAVSRRALPGPTATWKHLALPAALLRDGAALFHSPTGTLPLWTPCARLVTIHDLFAVLHPEWFPPRMALQLSRAQRWSARHAQQVLAVSEQTRQDLLERFAIPADRVTVVPNGIDHSRFQPASDAADADAVAAQFGVRRPFVLCVGSLMPWRNAPRLAEAVAGLRVRHGVPHELLFVGRDIWGTDPTANLARERGWDWVHFSGYVQDADLPRLYQAASVFAYPSLYEGFGIPPVEAMACGLPTVASTGGSLPEVLGDAALLPDPESVGALADALWTALDDDATRVKLIERGLQRAARYTWAAAAARTVQCYRDLACGA